MIDAKASKRIEQYLDFLERKSYAAVSPTPQAQDPVTCPSDWTDPLAGPCEFSPWKAWRTESVFRTPPAETENWRPIQFPFSYGEGGETWWFTAEVAIPEAYGPELFLRMETETDTLVFIDGTPAGAVNPFHRRLRIVPFCGRGGTRLTLHLEAWAGHSFPGYHPFNGPRVLTTVALRKPSYPLVFREPTVLRKVPEVYGLQYDVLALYRLALTLPGESFLRERIISSLHRELLAVDFTSSLPVLRVQAEGVRKAIRPLLEAKNGTIAPAVFSFGNAHLDHAWLWPIAETERKAARTCANMASLAAEYPEFRFLFSQPVQMKALAGLYPAVFLEVKKAFERGQWEPNGVSWVEPDCVLSGGESLIRQFILGRRTTRELFPGYEGDVFWAPDSFGFTASLPQILAGCGIKYFVTSKLSWNDTNRLPYDVFSWEGIDGSSIPAVMITTAYEGRNDPQEIASAWEKIRHKDIQKAVIRSIGEGDGGGGTLRSDLELMRRMGDLQGLPRNRWTTLSEACRETINGATGLPRYRGELYLELHRGTLTSQAEIKRYNRRLENRLHELEYIEAMAVLKRKGLEDPEGIMRMVSDLRDGAWEIVLTNQFHDILPGSSIRRVNEEALASYKEAEEKTEKAVALLDRLFPSSGTEKEAYWNPRCCPRTILVSEGEDISRTGTPPRGPLTPLTILPLSTAHIDRNEGSPFPRSGIACGVSGRTVKTPWGSVSFGESGEITSCVYGARELAVPGRPMNSLSMIEDFPVNWDAWDIEADYALKTRKRIELSGWEVVVEDPLAVRIRMEFALGESSTMDQYVTFYAHTSRIDFTARVNWLEHHALLRVEFPTAIRSDTALFDIPFGYLSRSTGSNTPYERAQFEASGHQWVLIEDREMTAALITDCKYGYRAKDGTLSVSLLRSPTAPDPMADIGAHEFTYSFFLTNEGLASVISEGMAVNSPPIPVSGGIAELLERPICGISLPSVVLETCKLAEPSGDDPEGRDIVLRFRETMGVPARCSIALHPLLSGYEGRCTDLLESETAELRPEPDELGEGPVFSLEFRGFELKTVAFRKKPRGR